MNLGSNRMRRVALAIAAAVLCASAPATFNTSVAATGDVPELRGATPTAPPDPTQGPRRRSQPSPRGDSTLLSPNTQVTFYWGLARPEAQAEAAVASIATPGATAYRHFIGTKQAARRYGASRRTVRTVSQHVRSLGLRPSLDKSRLFLRVSGTVRELRRAFGVTFGSYRSEGFLIVQPNTTPSIRRGIRGLITEPIWISQQQLTVGGSSTRAAKPAVATARPARTARPGAVAVPSARSTARDSSPPTNTGTMIDACPRVSRQSAQYFSIGQEAVAYGIDQITSAGGRPQLGIVSSGSGFSNRILGRALRCFKIKGAASRVATDGMSRPLVDEPGGEADLDVQSSLEVLRRGGRVVAYEASDSDLSMFLPLAAALNSKRPPTVLSTSNGSCESELPQAVRTLTDALYKRLALIGTSSLSASGDSGSSDCWNGTGDPIEGAVDYPGSSPWVTSVGGTRLVFNTDNTRASEVVWNDSAWSSPPTAGGGGTSYFYPQPSWQADMTSIGSMRAVPDISAHASAYPSFPQVIAQGPGTFVQVTGGTSLSAPTLSAAFTLINERLRRSGQPSLGLLNPWLYGLPPGAIYDITSGTNDLFGIGCCTAAVGYDQASGLGSPNFAAMLQSVPPPG